MLLQRVRVRSSVSAEDIVGQSEYSAALVSLSGGDESRPCSGLTILEAFTIRSFGLASESTKFLSSVWG
jgi:hypothetical protein